MLVALENELQRYQLSGWDNYHARKPLTFEINEITFDKGIKFILEKKNNVMLLQPISNNWLFSFRNSEIHHQRKQEEFDRFTEANFYSQINYQD